jgi:glycosyltransferase involved in cell wall biosynthesis
MSAEPTLPLISCIMPTYNRREFVPRAILYFLRQDYPNKELVVIDDGEDAVGDLVPVGGQIRYYRLDRKITLGAKLNLACEYAHGQLIAHWDDDDWYAPRRLSYQAKELQRSGRALCGINRLLYYDLGKHQALEYIYPPDQRLWLIGSSLFYRKELWTSRRFADINVGMDGLFCWAAPETQVKVLADSAISVHMIHGRNVSPKRTKGRWWHPYPVEEIRAILGADWGFYGEDGGGVTPNAAVSFLGVASGVATCEPTPRAWRNVFACLVHEREDCIIDLVKNLHFHDPDAVILLYNGGPDPKLIGNEFPYEQFGAISHPRPSPVKWGYLHRFALDCMEYALGQLTFDSLTIVDSDQLCIRGGYSAYLGNFFSAGTGGTPRIGMLSSRPGRVTPADIQLQVPLQAFKEYELWKPLLQTFPDGEEKFVHWTFWPSSVFTMPACADLVKLFQENLLLQETMTRTKIWASEEVILPLLVRLLGYEITANPCRYDINRFRVPITAEELRVALSKSNVFWAHPVRRVFDDPIRTFIRQLTVRQAESADAVRLNGFGNHSVSSGRSSSPARIGPRTARPGAKVEAVTAVAAIFPVTLGPPIAPAPAGTAPFMSALISQIRKIGGWLSDGEARLLAQSTIDACVDSTLAHHIVEIGSYHGKSTVLFASVIKVFALPGTVHAIDVHDGRLGAADQGLKIYQPSFDIFSNNLSQAGVKDTVKIIRERSCNVEWGLPISLLFIDGLHDYDNVRRDFEHFAGWLVTGGLVAFHDYADYYPGVVKFVDELLAAGTCRKIGAVDSLIVLQKVAA